MFIPWKLYSFWLKAFAWISIGSAIILFFSTLSDSFATALLWLLYGAVAFVVWMAFAVCTSAAETYLVEHNHESEEDNSEVGS